MSKPGSPSFLSSLILPPPKIYNNEQLTHSIYALTSLESAMFRVELLIEPVNIVCSISHKNYLLDQLELDQSVEILDAALD